jgi:hypothetical protein
MSEQKYSDELITQYLLGSLSEEDTERFDELSISDDRFADLLRSAENDLVDAYVQGDLTGTELERFESHYLGSPLRREKAGFAEGFYQWTRKSSLVRAGASKPEERAQDSKASWFSSLGVFGRLPVWQWGLTLATMALLFAGGWLIFENMRAPRQIAQTEGTRDSSGAQSQQPEREPKAEPPKQANRDLVREQAERERLEQERKREQERIAEQERGIKEPQRGVSIASFLLTPQMRHAGQVREFSIPADRNYVVMHLQLEPNEFRAYRVYLLDGSGSNTLWQSSTLRPKATENTRTLEVGLRSAILKPQTYIMRVKGVSSGGSLETVGDYPFKIAK